MEVIFLLILISLAVAAGFLLAYLWAMRAGQYDDEYTPAVRMLFDDELISPMKGEVERENADEDDKKHFSGAEQANEFPKQIF